MSRMHVVHTTSFRYSGPVTASYNEARMTPLSEPGQKVLESSFVVDLHTWQHEYRDYWGTTVTAFEVSVPHDSLVITATSRVEVGPRRRPASSVGWADLRGERVRDAMAEYLADTPTTAAHPELADLAEETAAGQDPLEAAEAVCLAVREAMDYVPGATAVHTVAADSWVERKGVCQDMAHLSVGALRSLGIPARYVSGYLHPSRSADVGQSVVGESHAWVEWWSGEWVAYDPTNRRSVGEHHVVLGRGRAYGDVAPLRGIFAGAGTESLDVAVRMTQEA